MRLLTIAFAGTDQGGVHRKLAEQLREIRRHVPDTRALVFADTRIAPAPNDAPYELIDLPGGGFDATSRAQAFALCKNAVMTHAPDVVYMRYPLYDEFVYQFVREAPPVVFEIQTKFDLELPPAHAEQERAWARAILPLAAGLVAVTPELVTYEKARAGWEIPTHMMSNGADPATITFTTPTLDAQRTNLLCVASFYAWHGVDRIIGGMAAEAEVDMHLHLVGDGPALPAIAQLAEDLGLTKRVHLAGLITPDALTPWYTGAHLAVGVLAPHRKGLTELSALKHREYALRGVPFVAAGHDIDFPATLPWVKSVTADDSLLSPRALRSFALGWTNVRRRAQIRAWAESNISWAAKIPPLVDFLMARAAAPSGAR